MPWLHLHDQEEMTLCLQVCTVVSFHLILEEGRRNSPGAETAKLVKLGGFPKDMVAGATAFKIARYACSAFRSSADISSTSSSY